jgi:hypothetical protein
VIHRPDEGRWSSPTSPGATAAPTAALVLAGLPVSLLLPVHLVLRLAVIGASLFLAPATTPAAVVPATTSTRLHWPLGLRLRLRRLIHFIFHRCICLRI